MAQPTPPAFISYSREDSEFAMRLAEDLKGAGANVWLDQLDIQPGRRWDSAVEEALIHCPRMLTILSPASVNSTNVMDEVSFALEEKKTIIPIMYRDCAVPFRLRRVQYVDFRMDYSRGLKEVLKTLESEKQHGKPSSTIEEGLRKPETITPDAPEPLQGQTRPTIGNPAHSVEASTALRAMDSTSRQMNQTDQAAPQVDGTEIVPELLQEPKRENDDASAQEDRARQVTGEIRKSPNEASLSEEQPARQTLAQTASAKEVLPTEIQDAGASAPHRNGFFARYHRWMWILLAVCPLSIAAVLIYRELNQKPVIHAEGWAVGEDQSGTILHTDDGGLHWEKQVPPSTDPATALYFLTPQIGWILGEDGYLFHTEDGGRSWQQLIAGNLQELRVCSSMVFVNAQQGWVVGWAGKIAHTEDGGHTWQKQDGGTTKELKSIAALTPQLGWTVGEDGVILHTADGGRTWGPQNSGTGKRLSAVQFLTPELGWAAGTEGTVLRTTNGGTTWEGLATSSSADLLAIKFLTPDLGWVTGRQGAMIHTDNGGNSWQPENTGTSLGLLALDFVTGNAGWAVGESGVILHTEDGGQTWHAQKSGWRITNNGTSFLTGIKFFNPAK